MLRVVGPREETGSPYHQVCRLPVTVYRVRRIFQPARLIVPGAFHPDGLYGGRTRTSALTTGTAGISYRFAFSVHPIYQLSYTIIKAGRC